MHGTNVKIKECMLKEFCNLVKAFVFWFMKFCYLNYIYMEFEEDLKISSNPI
jgi:hypothetical protein